MINISPFPLIQERTNERGGWYIGTYMVSHFGDDADANADEEEEDDEKIEQSTPDEDEEKRFEDEHEDEIRAKLLDKSKVQFVNVDLIPPQCGLIRRDFHSDLDNKVSDTWTGMD